MQTSRAPGGDGREAGRSGLRGYLDARAAEGGRSTIPFSDVLRPFMSPGVRLRAKQLATAIAEPVERRKARVYAGGTLRLHLGSGGNNLAGWVNVDLVGARADVAWDLRHRLPFADGSAEAVFLEHVLEHMTVTEGIEVLCRIRPVLIPGGVLRVGVPDAGSLRQELRLRGRCARRAPTRAGPPACWPSARSSRSTVTSRRGTARPSRW